MRKLLGILLISALSITISCKQEKPELKTADSFLRRTTSIDSDYIGGAIIEFDSDGNMNISDYGRGNSSFSRTKSGLNYKFITKNNSYRPLIGDVLELDMKYYLNGDSLLFDTKDAGTAYRMRMETPSHKASIEEGFLMMGKGDSAIFKVDALSFFKYTRNLVHTPNYTKTGDKIEFRVKMIDIIRQTDFSLAMSETDRQYAVEELSMINRFLLNENLQAQPSKSGLYLINLESTNGKYPKLGNKVDIYYNAMFIDGGLFDAVEPGQRPFSFTIGNEEVIEGIEEAVNKMREGEIALAIIPFRLAYGSEKYLEIPPYSTLLFEIKLEKIHAK